MLPDSGGILRDVHFGEVAFALMLTTGWLHGNVQRLRGGLASKAHRLCVSLNPGLESNKEEEEGSLLGNQ